MFSENSLRPLFTFALNVSKQFLFSDGVIASRFRPSVVVGLLRDAVQELKRGHFNLKLCGCTRNWWTFFSVDEGGESC